MRNFIPQKILVEEAVREKPLTARILKKFPLVPVEYLSQQRFWKEPVPITAAKRILGLAEFHGEALKPFPKIKNALNLGDYVFNPVSNCHLECTYCILQSYLKNNPVLTVFANIDHFQRGIEERIKSSPDRTYRLGTGELSDSLALDSVTELSAEWVPFFAGLPNAFLELKTKSDCIENLLSLEHRGHTVVSWSLSPERIIQEEELKCADLHERLESAGRVQEAGYPVGIHLDPLIYFEDWKNAYEALLDRMKENLDPRGIAWVSMGTLRFDKTLKEMATARFPRSKIFSDDFIAAPDGKMRYFKTIRISMYREIWRMLSDWSEEFPRYLCMEPPWMWEEVTGAAAPDPEKVEAGLVARLHQLA